MKKVLLHEMTRGYFEKYLKANPKAVAIIPLGSIEQHGPHLPLGSDSFSALEKSIRIAELTDSFVVQPCLAGYSPHHLDFKGTISLKSDTLINVLMDTIESLKLHGILKVMFINCHQGNEHIIEYVAKEARLRYNISISFPRLPSLADRLKERKYNTLDIHAGKGETSVMLKVTPDLVEMSRVKGWKPSVKLKPELVDLIKKEPKGEIDKLLIETVLPQMSSEVTNTGVYGFSNPNEALVKKDDFEKSIELLAEFVKRWKDF